MDTFLKREKLMELYQKEIINLTRLIKREENELMMQKIPTKENPHGFNAEF